MESTEIKKATACLVCHKPSLYVYYGVPSCEACKQFFHRIVIKQKDYQCVHDYLEKGEKCRACRLSKCLLVGMEPARINCFDVWDECRKRYLQKLNERKKELIEKFGEKSQQPEKTVDMKPIILEKNIQPESPELKFEFNESAILAVPSQIGFSKMDMKSNPLAYLSHLIYAHKRIWNRSFDVTEDYLNIFTRIEDILCGEENILAHYESFSPYPENFPVLDLNKLYREMDSEEDERKLQIGISRMNGVYKLLAVGILKAMGTFSKITFEDRILLARELSHQITHFFNAYYSSKMGHPTIVCPYGISPFGIFKANFKEEPRVMSLAEKVYIRPLAAFLPVQILEQEEFALLLAILSSNPGVSGLSEYAKELLYADQVEYSQLFMQYLQMNFGGEKGAKRFAECLHLIENAVRNAHNYELLNTYMDVFHKQGKNYFGGIYPECLKIITK